MKWKIRIPLFRLGDRTKDLRGHYDALVFDVLYERWQSVDFSNPPGSKFDGNPDTLDTYDWLDVHLDAAILLFQIRFWLPFVCILRSHQYVSDYCDPENGYECFVCNRCGDTLETRF